MGFSQGGLDMDLDPVLDLELDLDQEHRIGKQFNVHSTTYQVLPLHVLLCT